jgi:hypothetical protein
MKISFPKYGLGELLTRKPSATGIISFIAIAFFSALCGTYLLGNKLWLLTITVIGIAGALLCFGLAVAIFLNKSEVNETPSAFIEENVPRLTPQWDYRPRKAIRRYATVNGAAADAAETLNSNPSEANTSDDAWFSFINVDPAAKDATTNPPILGDGRALSTYD